MKKYLPVLFLIIFLAPSVALASWWNPFSWKVFKKREPAPQVQVINTEKEKTSEEKIVELQKQLDELKTKKTTEPVVQPITGNNNIQKKTGKTVTTPDNPKTTIIIPPAVNILDVCKNIEGIQNIAPEGMIADSGNCSKVDLCPYLAYDQFVLPGGMVRDPDGMCYYPGDDFCPNIPGLQNQLPDGYNQTSFRGDCVKLETKVSTEKTFSGATSNEYSSLGRNKGVVVFSKSGCDYYLVETSLGYSLLEWYGGFLQYEGDTIYGNLNSYGFKDITNDSGRSGRAWIDDWMLSRSRALEKYYDKCD